MPKDLPFEEQIKREKISEGINSPLVAACLIFFLRVLLGSLQEKILVSVEGTALSFWVGTFLPLLFSGIAVLLPFWIYTKLVQEKIKPIFEKERLSVNPGVLIAGILSVCGFGILFRYFAMLLTGTMESAGFVFVRNLPPTDIPLVFLIASAIIPALFYEIALRGIMAERLKDWSPAAAIVLSALVYSVCQLSLDIMPHAFACGLILGWLYIRTGSILLTLAANAVTNGVLAWLWLSDSLTQTVAVVGGIIGIAGLIICILLLKDKPKPESRFAKKDILRGVFTAFALYTLLVITFLGLMFYHIDKPEPDKPQNESSVVSATETETSISVF